MSDIQKLGCMIKDVALVKISTTGNRPSVDLIGSCKTSFKIRGLPQHSIVIKADEFPTPKDFFKGVKGENKRADFILIADKGNRKWIVFIEMKKSKVKNIDEIIQQLKGAECVLTYCRCIAKRFWNCKNLLDEKEYMTRFIHITTGNIRKRPTKYSNTSIHDRPENMLKLGNLTRYEFNKLVGKNSV